MVRRAVYIVSAVSLVLLACCAALWVRSYFALDEFRYGGRGSPTGLGALDSADGIWSPHYVWSSGKGKIQWLRSDPQSARGLSIGWASKTADDVFSLAADRPVDRAWRLLGVEYFDRPRHSYQQEQGTWTRNLWAFRYVTVPYLVLCLFFGMMSLPAVIGIGRAFRRRRRAHNGLCATCGYDLRGNSSGRCPECGSVTSAGTA